MEQLKFEFDGQGTETSSEDMMFLEVAVEEAIERVKRVYDQTNGNVYLAFSGGKDSTIVAELIKMAGLPVKIPFFFANTGIELKATVDFVKQFDYENIIIRRPRKPFGQVIKEYGIPAIGKLKSEHLSTYQKHLENPMDYARCRQMITGEAEKGGQGQGFLCQVALKYEDFHFLHPDLEYKVANKCCLYMKKYPSEDFAKENNMEGQFTGIRQAEGGVRAIKYTTCTTFKKLGGKDFLVSMPIIDWSDSLCDLFVEKYNVQLSKAYTEYGCTRTGCVGCPFSKNIKEDLHILHKHEPLIYKASMKWMGTVYQDQGVECEWDEEYMKKFEERTKVNDERKMEMVEKYKPHFNPEVRRKARFDSFMKKMGSEDRM